jgi:hypothetical protein
VLDGLYFLLNVGAGALYATCAVLEVVVGVAVLQNVAVVAFEGGQFFRRDVERDHLRVGWRVVGQQQGGCPHEGAELKQLCGVGQFGQAHQNAAFKQGHAANVGAGYVDFESDVLIGEAVFNVFEQHFGANGCNGVHGLLFRVVQCPQYLALRAILMDGIPWVPRPCSTYLALKQGVCNMAIPILIGFLAALKNAVNHG